MTEPNVETDGREPATPEMMELLLQNLQEKLPELVKSISASIGHDLVGGPDTIYQYTDINGLRGMIEKNAIWTTAVGYLNDTTEYTYGQQLFVGVIEKYLAMPEKGQWKTVLELVLPTLNKVVANNVFVACFASNDDQLSQWRGYARDGYGYAVGFDMSAPLEIEPTPLGLQIMYEPTMQQQFADALLQQTIGSMAEGLYAVGIEPTPQAVAELLPFAIRITIPAFKHPSFAEEREVRMFLDTHFDKESRENLVFHERKGILVPHIPLKWKDGKLPIKEIIVGPNLNYAQAAWSLDHFLKQHGYTDVSIRRSSVPYLS